LGGQREFRFDRNEGTFVEVNAQTSRSREVVKDFFEVSNVLWHRAREVIDKGWRISPWREA
jgi:hypothetical protein